MELRQRINLYSANAERFLLYALAFTLPTVEAAKTLSAFLFLVCWLLRTGTDERPKNWRWDGFDWIIAALFLVNIVSTWHSIYFDTHQLKHETKGLRDLMLWAIPMWLIYRSAYPATVRNRLLTAILAGAFIGMLVGIWKLEAGTKPDLEFLSAGIVTQSVIYLGIAILLVLGQLAEPGHRSMTRQGLLWWGLLLFFSGCFIVMGSRGGILAMIVTLIVISTKVFTSRKLKHRLYVAVALVAVTGVMAYIFTPDNLKENRSLGEKLEHMIPGAKITDEPISRKDPAISDKIRFENWRIAWAQITQGDRPWLGLGPMKYPKTPVYRLHFDPPLKAWPFDLNHAHDLFLNKMVEEGAIGLAVFLVFIGYIGFTLFSGSAWTIAPRWLWVGAVGAWLIPLVVGLFGSPWAREPALLSGIVIALYLSNRKSMLAAARQSG